MGGDINTVKTTNMVGEQFGRSTSEGIVRSREYVSYTSTIVPRICGWLGGSLGENSQFIRIAEKCLWDVAFRWQTPPGKFWKPSFMRNEVSLSLPTLSWSGFRSTEWAIFRSCPMVAKIFSLNLVFPRGTQ